MGNVRNHPIWEDLAGSEAWKLTQQFKEYASKECESCSCIEYCHGGCPYNAITKGGGKIKGVDPYCAAYKRIFDETSDRFNKEISELLGQQGTMGTEDTQTSPLKKAKPGIMAIMRKISSNQKPA